MANKLDIYHKSPVYKKINKTTRYIYNFFRIVVFASLLITSAILFSYNLIIPGILTLYALGFFVVFNWPQALSK